MRKKLTVVGAGQVGGTLAQRLAETDFGDVVLIDIPQTEGMPAGKALDILESGPALGFNGNLTGSTDYGPSANSDIVVITAGLPRKPGMSRDDLLRTNAGIVKNVSSEIARLSPNAIIIVVSNPLDAMCYVTLKTTGFPGHRVIGMAGILDAARMSTFIAQELKVSPENIQAMVLGGHGDTMVPLPRFTTVAGVPITELLPQEKIASIVQRTRDGGAEIVKLLKTGSAYYAPSASVLAMIAAIIKDKKKILPCAAYLEGEYGFSGIFLGVPVKLGSKGIEEIVKLKLTDEEKRELNRSAEAVKELIKVLEAESVKV